MRERRLHLHVPRRLVGKRVDRRDAPGELDARHVTGRDPDAVTDAYLRDVLLRHTEVHVDRIQRLQRNERIAGGQVLPEVDLADAEKSGKRGADRLPLDRGVDLADLSVRLFLFGYGPVELRLRNDAVAQQALHPVVVERGQIALRFDRGQLRALLPGVELRQDVTLPDRPTGFERDAMDGARQVRTHRHSLHRRHRPDSAQRRRPLLLLRHDRRHGLRGRLKCGALGHRRLYLAELHEAEAREDCEDHREHENHPFQHDNPFTPSTTRFAITSDVTTAVRADHP